MRFWIRLARWARNPPSKQQRMIFAIAVGGALVLFGIEYFFGWPEWLSVNKTPRVRLN